MRALAAQRSGSASNLTVRKFVENIVQAISRDILMYAIRTLSHCFIVGHVHDELIIECSMSVSLDAVCEQDGKDTAVDRGAESPGGWL